MEEILEMREQCQDSLLRFRSGFADATNQVQDAPLSPEFAATCQRIIEDTVEPALADLRRQQGELARTTSLTALKGAPAAALGTFGISFMASLEPLTAFTLGGLSTAAHTLYRLFEHRSKATAIQEGNAFALLLQPPKRR